MVRFTWTAAGEKEDRGLAAEFQLISLGEPAAKFWKRDSKTVFYCLLLSLLLFFCINIFLCINILMFSSLNIIFS